MPESIPPYIDALDGIAPENATWDPNPLRWPHSAPIQQRGSPIGETEAMVKLRIEGKGDPVSYSMPQQLVIILDQSQSMGTTDVNGVRCAGLQRYIGLMTNPDEAALVSFSTSAALDVASTTNYLSVSQAISCTSSGGSNVREAVKAALDELVPRKKAGFNWAILLVMDDVDAGSDPQAEIDRAVQEKVRMFTVCPVFSGGCAVASMRDWANRTGGKYYNVQNTADFDTIYYAAGSLQNNISGTPPKSGKPMLRARMMNDIEVVPGSFRCDSASCVDPSPNNSASIAPGNRGLLLEWPKPVAQLPLKQWWQATFLVRSYAAGAQVKLNDIVESYVEYDRYDGSPGGTDFFEQLTLDVEPDPCATSCLANVVLSPASADLLVGDVVQFRATAYDQNGAPLANVTLAWNTSGGIGTVDQTGLLTATAPGTGQVVVSATSGPIVRNASARVTVTQPIPVIPAVVSTVPANGATGVSTTTAIMIFFSTPMDRAATEAAVSSVPAVSGSFSWTNGDRDLTLTPAAPLAPGTIHRVTVSTGAGSAKGVKLPAATTFSFVTSPLPDTTPPVIEHTPPSAVEEGTPLTIEAKVSDDRGVVTVILHYRRIGDSGFRTAQMGAAGSDRFTTTIPGAEVLPLEMEYYLQAADGSANEARSPPDAPDSWHSVGVTPKTIPPPPPPPPGQSLDLLRNPLVWAILAIVIAVATLIAALALRSRRRARPAPPPNPWATSPPVPNMGARGTEPTGGPGPPY